MIPELALAASVFAFSPPPHTSEDLNKPHMQFTVEDTTLFAWGGVGAGDDQRFQEAIKVFPGTLKEIALFSPGGHMEEGLEIGRIIRKAGLNTEVRRGELCISACNFMFLGGVERHVEIGGGFVVHMFYDGLADALFSALPQMVREASVETPGGMQFKPTDEIHTVLTETFREESAHAVLAASQIALFLLDMDISPRFLEALANIPTDSPRALTRDELRELRVIN